jgi:DNA polymerase
VDEGRGELLDIVREARVVLQREHARGRTRIGVKASAASSAVAEAEVGLPPPPLQPTEVLVLPGFEAPAPARPAPLPGGQPLAVRTDLPQDLAGLAQMVSTCRKCRLCETRTQTVFADGNPNARLVLVGEAPGRDEDAQGVPFVGRAGQLLNKMLAAIDLKREEVYICNVLKCRPPENRTPLPEEVRECEPYLAQQIALVRPALICALGLSAAQALLGTKASMTSMRGRLFEYRGIPLLPTYHPAALLRNPALKREAWVDLKLVRDLLRQGSAA